MQELSNQKPTSLVQLAVHVIMQCDVCEAAVSCGWAANAMAGYVGDGIGGDSKCFALFVCMT